MYNSQYYTCEQIDQRLLQGYVDDYNTQTGQSLTKEQFLTKLGNIFSKEGVIDNTATQIGYYECDTAAGTAAKAITVHNYSLFAGGSMKVKFVSKNTANNATLNINSKGAKALYYQGERASSTNSWDEGEVVEIYYDGTSYYANNVKGGSGSGVYDVSKEHPTSGPNSDGKFTLEYILDSSNVNELIPVNKRYSGMYIQFISTSDNKYVQYRLMSNAFSTDESDWQGVDERPTQSSDNLVKSNGIYNALGDIDKALSDEITGYTLYNYGILGGGTFSTDTNYKHAAIAVTPGEKYILKRVYNTVRYAFATSNSYSKGGDIPLVDGTSVVLLPSNGYEELIEIPEGCNYLLFNAGNSTYPTYSAQLWKYRSRIENALTTEDVVNDLESGGAKKALSAEQGKLIADICLKVVEPTNLLDPSSIVTRRCLNRNTGGTTTTVPSASYGITPYIEIDERGLICNHAMASVGNYACGACIYDENFTFLTYRSVAHSGDALAIDKTGHDDWKYVRFGLAIAEGGYAVYRGLILPEEFIPWEPPYYEMAEPNISDRSISFEKIGFVVTQTGKNKLNPSTIRNNYNVNYKTGTLKAIYSSALKATDYIQVSKNGLVCNHAAPGPGVTNIGYAVYDSDKNYIRGVSAPSNTYTYQEGDAYIRFSLAAGYTQYMVEEGNVVTEYEPYVETSVIDPEVLPKSSLSEEDINIIKGELSSSGIYTSKLEMLLPQKFYYVKGDTLQLFYKGMIKAIGLENRYVKPTCPGGTIYRRYLEIKSDSSLIVGNKSLNIKVYDDNLNVLSEGSSEIQVVKAPVSPATPKHVLCLGASTTEGGKWPCECQRRLLASDGTPQGKGLTNLTFVGSMSKTLYGQTAHFFARSGWAWRDICTEGRGGKTFRFYLSGQGNQVQIDDVYTNNGFSYTVVELNTIDDIETILCSTSSASNVPQSSGTLTLSSGGGSPTLSYTAIEQGSANPFWDSVESKLSFKPYVDEYCGGHIDIVYTLFATNRIYADSPSVQKELIRSFVSQLHSEYPDCIVVLATQGYPSMINMTPGYGANDNLNSNEWRTICKEFDLFKMYKELANELDYVEFESWSAQFDADYNFPLTQKAVNTRNTSKTEPYANNTVHPGDAGYMQYADAAYRSIVAHFCQGE